MADDEKNIETSFILDSPGEDDGPVPGGFEDAELPMLTDDDPEGEALEAKPEEKPEEGDGEEPEEGDGEEPEPDEKYHLLEAQNQQMLTAMNNMQAELVALRETNKQSAKKAEPVDPDPGYVDPTEDEWANDPTAAEAKIYEHRKKVEAYQKEQAEAESAEAAATSAEITRVQNESWNSAKQICPQVGVNGNEVRNTMGAIYNNPDLGLKNSKVGPLAATAIAMIMHGAGFLPADGSTEAPSAEQTLEEKKKAAVDEGIKLEKDRQARLKKGNMQAGGDGGTPGTKVELDDMHKRVARQLGVSDEAMAESVASLR